jgi:nucleoside phosphorylase
MMAQHLYSGAQLSRADVLLVTVTEIETAAIRRLFSGLQKHFIGDKTYYELGEVSSTIIFLVQSEMGAGGVGGAIRTVEKGIELLSPPAVIMVGIAFGVDPLKQQIGDILVSQRILDYELQRVSQVNTALQIIPRGDKISASLRLLDRCRDGVMEWQESGEAGNVLFGLILSGAKLVDNRDFREQLRSFAPEAIGGEMEGAGLYAAAQGNKVDWILVKAISDWADGNKAEDKQTRQEQAAARAARFVFHVIKQGGLRREGPKLQRQDREIPSSEEQASQVTPIQSLTGSMSTAIASGGSSLSIGRDNVGSIVINRSGKDKKPGVLNDD